MLIFSYYYGTLKKLANEKSEVWHLEVSYLKLRMLLLYKCMIKIDQVIAADISTTAIAKL